MREVTENGDGRSYSVVGNHGERYSTWATDKPVPDGWIVTRPASLRRAMTGE